jgi:hypothetical protein
MGLGWGGVGGRGLDGVGERVWDELHGERRCYVCMWIVNGMRYMG